MNIRALLGLEEIQSEQIDREENILEESANRICKALAVNPKQYTSDAYYWLSKHLVTDHSPKIQRHRKVIWLKNRQNWEYTPSEICCLPRVEQGALAIELMSFEGFNWTMLESMFARRKMYIKTRIEDALSDITRGSSLKVTWDNFKATTEAKKLTKKA